MTMHSEPTNPFQIQTSFSSANNEDLSALLCSAEKIIQGMFPDIERIKIKKTLCPDEVDSCFYRINKQIPILQYSVIAEHSKGLLLKILCQTDFIEGISRYIPDIFSRWLIPGKRIAHEAGIGLQFSFAHFPQKQFYFRQEYFQFDDPAELSQALQSIPSLIEETRINILAAYQARYLTSLKSLSSHQRSELIRQNASLFFSNAHPSLSQSAFHRTNLFLTQLSEEEKFGIVKKTMHYLTHARPQDFDTDIFREMSDFTSRLRDAFTMTRDPRHISRIVAFHYLFKKNLLQSIQEAPGERHLSIKLVKAQLNAANPVIGILIGMNLLRESEPFDRKHLLSAIQSCLPLSTAVADSYVVDRQEETLRIFYLEIQKPQNSPFTLQEIRNLKELLPERLKRRVDNIVHPIFMPRNEEEVLRTIVVLSKQMKFLRDLPHLTIHYEKQSDSEITFLIVLVRILKETDLPFKELMQSSLISLRIMIDEIRSAGSLKRRFPKEAVVFRAMLDKSPFFRKDLSLDLKRARQKVAAELRQLLGDFRDFNGGMIHKQDEALEQLRKTIGAPAVHHEILLENFFYSLRPGIMQTILPSELLRSLFTMLLEVLDEDLAQKSFSLKVSGEGKYFLAMIGAAAPTFKEEVMSAVSFLRIPSYDLTTTFLHVQENATLGYILRTENLERRSQFQQSLLDAMLKWKINFSCRVIPVV